MKTFHMFVDDIEGHLQHLTLLPLVLFYMRLHHQVDEDNAYLSHLRQVLHWLIVVQLKKYCNC